MTATDRGPDLQLGALGIRFVVEAADTDGTHTVLEVIVPPGARVPLAHSHDAFEETFLGLEGVATITIDGAEHRIGPGEGICTRRGQVHSFRNDTDAEVRFVGIAAPGVFGRPYFEELAEAMAAGGPPDPAVIGAIMRKHGLTPAPPSTAS